MANKKIKNWHLDDSLRLQIESGSGGGAGSSAALEAALAQYVKKTDKITRTQLADSVFDNVNTSIGNLRNELGQYRAIATPIGRSDLSSALQTELDTLALTASSLPADFDTRVETAITNKIGSQEFEDQIVNLVTTQYASSVTSLQNVVGDNNSGLVKDVNNNTSSISTINSTLTTLQSNLGTLQNTVSTVQTNIGTLQTNYGTINNSLTSLDSRVTNLEAQDTLFTASLLDINNSLSDYRLKSDPIGETDLSSALQTKIQGYDSSIPSIVSDVSNLEVKVDNLAIMSYSALITNVATTSSELSTLKTNLSPSILYLPSMTTYAIDEKEWNGYASTIINSTSEISYSDAVISSTNIDTGSLTASINSGTITINNNTNDFGSLLFGIYGKNLKINVNVPSGSGRLPISLIIDKQLFPFAIDQEESNSVASLYVENMSHGAHRIEIVILPNTEFSMSSTIGVTDDSNSGLLISSDIPSASTYDNIMYNNVNYFNLSSMNGTYTFTEPNNFDTVDQNSYIVEAYDMNAVNGKIIYSQFNQKAYIMNNRKLVNFVI